MTSNDNAEPSNTISAAAKPKEYKEDPKQGSAQAIGPGSEHAQPQPVTHCPNSCQNKKHWLEYATFIVATFGFVAALFAAGFTGWQAWIAKDTEKRQLRAYVNIGRMDLQRFGIGNVGHIEGIIENAGQTPAHDAGWQSGIHIIDFRAKPTFTYDDCSVIRKLSEYPRWSFGKISPVDKDRLSAFTADEIKRVQDGAASVYFHGRLCYLDIFEEEQFTDFCVYWKWENGRLGIGIHCPKSDKAT